MLAAPDREVVDPEHPRGRRGGIRNGHDEPEQDLPGRGDAQAEGQPRFRPPGQCDRDAPEPAGQQWRLPRVTRGQAVDLLGERLALATGSRAEELPHRQQDLHLSAPDRGVCQLPGIAAVNPAQHRPALRARGLGGTRPGHHEQQPGRHRDLSTTTPARCGKRMPSSTAPGHDKHTSPCDNDTTDSWKNSRLRQPLDYQESTHFTQ